MWKSTARNVLFGRTDKITLRNVMQSTALSLVGVKRQDTPTFGVWLRQMTVDRLFAIAPARDEMSRLPRGWPRAVFSTVDREIQAKGGTIKLEDGATIPAFKLVAAHAAVLPHMWTAYIKPQSAHSDFKKVYALADSIVEALAQTGKQLSVRVLRGPLRVEIDRPDAEVLRLSDDWELLKAQPVNRYEYVWGMHYADKRMVIGLGDLQKTDEFSGVVAGKSGAGKSQWALDMLLSAALNTSPDRLSLIICDPKNVEYGSLTKLPHVAHDGILTDVDDCRAAILLLLAEMDRRVKVGDRRMMSKRILLYIDELPDLMSQDDGTIEKALIRLAQKGRSWGINIFVGAQKATKDVFSSSILSNLGTRIVLRVGSFYESNHISGQDGCQAHKLPGNGAGLIYNGQYTEGLRIQSHFVAAAESAEFDRVVGGMVADICERWQGIAPHWRLTLPDENSDDTGDEVEISSGGFEPSFIVAMSKAYADEPGKFSANLIRKEHKRIYGAECGHKRAKPLYDLIIG